MQSWPEGLYRYSPHVVAKEKLYFETMIPPRSDELLHPPLSFDGTLAKSTFATPVVVKQARTD
jgi:hypothetical protein